MKRVWFVAAAAALTLATTVALRERYTQDDGAVMPSLVATAAVSITRVRLATGVELEVAQAGAKDGQPVLFLHGYTDSWHSYSRVLELLPDEVRAIVPSQRGHGDAERPMCCYGVDDFVRDAVALLDALGIDRADVVGHSFGSFVAQRIAIEHPARVRRLVLIGSGTTLATPVLIEVARLVRTLEDPIDRAFIREFQASTAHSPLSPEFLDRIVAESGKVPARVWQALAASAFVVEAASDFGRIDAPTLVLWGEHDEMFDRAAQDSLVRAIADARLIVYPGVAHAPHWERPARVVPDLLEFLSRARSGRA